MPDQESGLAYELSFQDIIRILEVVRASNCHEMDVEVGPLRIRLTRDGRTGEGAGPASPDDEPPDAMAAAERRRHRETRDAPVTTARPAPAGHDIRPAAEGEVPVASPIGGVFYRASGPGQAPFVDVGSVVEPGDVLGLVEVMKLFTPVKAPVKGTVRAIHAGNEEAVEAGRVLVTISQASA